MKSNLNSVVSSSNNIVFVALFIALIAVSAQITVPFGPIPVTLQMFAIPLAMYVLRPSLAISSVYGYITLGALGLPVFSAGRGGFAALVGPTGGFLCGYLIAVPLACLFLMVARKAGFVQWSAPADPLAPRVSWAQRGLQVLKSSGVNFVAGVIFTAISYICGTLWFASMSGVPVQAALATCVLPFILPDALKIACACVFANAVVPLAHLEPGALSFKRNKTCSVQEEE